MNKLIDTNTELYIRLKNLAMTNKTFLLMFNLLLIEKMNTIGKVAMLPSFKRVKNFASSYINKSIPKIKVLQTEYRKNKAIVADSDILFDLLSNDLRFAYKHKSEYTRIIKKVVNKNTFEKYNSNEKDNYRNNIINEAKKIICNNDYVFRAFAKYYMVVDIILLNYACYRDSEETEIKIVKNSFKDILEKKYFKGNLLEFESFLEKYIGDDNDTWQYNEMDVLKNIELNNENIYKFIKYLFDKMGNVAKYNIEAIIQNGYKPRANIELFFDEETGEYYEDEGDYDDFE